MIRLPLPLLRFLALLLLGCLLRLPGQAQSASGLALMTTDLTIPAGCLLQYERISLDSVGRAGNRRVYLSQGGAWFRQANAPDGPPGQTWDTAYADTPLLVLDSAAQAQWQQTVAALDLAALATQYPPPTLVRQQGRYERWTFLPPGAEAAEVFLIIDTARPPALDRLKAHLDALLRE